VRSRAKHPLIVYLMKLIWSSNSDIYTFFLCLNSSKTRYRSLNKLEEILNDLNFGTGSVTC
jgi:hypothetical protein